MFIEEILAPFRNENLGASTGKEEFRSKLVRLLGDIEKRPLRSSEVTLLKATINENLARFELENDKKLISSINSRFSYEFLPGISTLGLSKPQAKVPPPSSVEEIEGETGMNGHPAATNPPKAINNRLLRVNSNSGRVIYQLCSVRRQQTALWSSYKMYADGTKEFDAAGALLSTSMNEVPVLLFGAKKFKGGTAAQSLVWNLADVKLWKEKAAVGRITKQASNMYYGSLLPGPASASDALSIPSPVARSPSAQSVDTDVGNALTSDSGEPVRSGSKNSSISEAVPPGGHGDMGVGIAESVVTATSPTSSGTLPRVTSSRWTFRGAGSAPPPAHPTSSGSTTVVSAAAAVAVQESSIAVCVNCKGMDKLIHLSGLAARVTSTTPLSRKASLTGEQSDTDTDNGSKLSVSTLLAPMGEQAMLEHLEALQRDELSLPETELLGLVQLMSKLPRKIPTAGGKTMHSVAFGRESRVRAASRKNLVIECVTAPGQAAEASSVEWASDANKLPLLQVTSL